MDTTQPVKATKICKYCKSEVAKDAKICPHCRKTLVTSTGVKIILGFIALIFVTSFISSYLPSSQPSTSVAPALSQAEIKQIGDDVDAWKKTPSGQLCAKHDTFSRQDCDLIVAGKINVGMSYDALVYMRGKPNTINPSNYGGKTSYQYCWDDYTPSCFYDHDGDGILDSFN